MSSYAPSDNGETTRMPVRVGFDIGGTFTDLALVDTESGAWKFFKIRATPGDQSQAALEGVRGVLERANRQASSVGFLAHGTTIATNTVIERSGARTALVTTDGFRDVLEIRRQVMPHRYDLSVLKPVPLVPREWRWELPERVLADGEVELRPDIDHLDKLIEEMRRQGIEAIAVAFLHSYANPENELQVSKALREAADWYVCASSDVVSEFREYERTSTAVANAYLAPRMRQYLGRLGDRLGAEGGITAPMLIFQSNGGLAPVSHAGEVPVASVLSGPAAGVIAANAIARRALLQNVVTLDMGGTSCDVSLISEGEPTIAYEQELDGWPLRTARIDIHTVGAGGGSVAWIAPGGLLQVGPRSAGADPGPASYGRGGKDPTVTDANLILGRLHPEYILGGRMPVDRLAAEGALDTLASALGIDTVSAARGVVEVVNAAMVRAIRVVSVERGFAPEEFALLAFGGAGPLHACELAREIGMREVIIPPHPGVLCALGLLVSDLRIDGSLSARVLLGQTDDEVLHATFARVEESLRASIAVSSQPDLPWSARYSVDVRYRRQSFQLRVVLGQDDVEAGLRSSISTLFDTLHERTYGFAHPDEEREIVCFRVALVAEAQGGADVVPGYDAPPVSRDDQDNPARQVFFQDYGWQPTVVLSRSELISGARFSGPAVVEEEVATTLIPPDCEVVVDDSWNLRVSIL